MSDKPLFPGIQRDVGLIAKLRVERDEARAAFVECYRAVPTSSCDQACDCRHCTARTEYAALYVACTKGGEPDASSQ